MRSIGLLILLLPGLAQAAILAPLHAPLGTQILLLSLPFIVIIGTFAIVIWHRRKLQKSPSEEVKKHV